MIQVSIARLAECKWNTLVVIEEAVPASLLVFAAVGREEAGSVKVLAGFDLASVARSPVVPKSNGIGNNSRISRLLLI